jgi:DNA polymerase-3 subunit delta'
LDWLAGQGVPDAQWLLRACGDEPLTAQQAAAQGLTAALWRALPQQVLAGDPRSIASMEIPAAVRCLQQICHDAMAVRAGGEPRFFPADALPRLTDWDALATWSRALAQAARQQDHPWNAALMLESLLLQGRQALRANAHAEQPGRAGSAARLATLRP